MNKGRKIEGNGNNLDEENSQNSALKTSKGSFNE